MTKHRGSEGGAADEAGGQYRRAVAALFAAHGLNGISFEGLPLGGDQATVEGVALETDNPVDDVLVQFAAGRLFIQAKRTLNFGRPLLEVTAQWLRAVRDHDFRPTVDFIAAAAGTLSEPTRALAKALDRRRMGAQIISRAETEAIERVRTLLKLRGAQPTEAELILSRAVVLQLQVEDPSHEHAERGRLLLDGHVVPKGEGSRAWRELISIAGDAARMRIGHSVESWLEQLRKRQVPLVVDEGASRAAHLQNRYEAIGRYRQQLRYRGEHVDLTMLGARIPQVLLSEMDAGIEVRDPSTEERERRDLLWSFRRRGQVLLTGLPGGGKSTSIGAAVAEWVRREHWALPIAISLRRIAERERFRKRPLRDELLDIAIEPLDPRDRLSVREALDEALRTGHAALFLDGLDEAADRSLLVAADIAQLLADLHPDTDVLLATRDIAYADAQILRFMDLRITPPSNTRKAVEGVLRAIAAHRGLAERADAWVAARLTWVERCLELDSQLSETPLLPVLLALLAAARDTGDLPRRRSLILRQVIEDIVRAREVKRDLRIPGIPMGHEAEAILYGFPVIAHELTKLGGSAPRTQIASELAARLQHSWGHAPSVAAATAKDILVFWDEAGIFVASGGEAIVAPRIRMFLEIGEAEYAASLPPDEVRTWVEGATSTIQLKEALTLAAGLSRTIADTLIDRSCRGNIELGDIMALAAAEALGQGGTASEPRLRELIQRLILLLRPANHRAWIAFQAILRLPTPVDLQGTVIHALGEVFPSAHITVGTALAALEWRWPDDRRNLWLERSLGVHELPSLERKTPKKGFSIDDMLSNRPLMRVKQEAAAILLPGRGEFAPLVVRAMNGTTMDTESALIDILRSNGHIELADEATQRRLLPFRSTLEHISQQSKWIDEGVASFLKKMAILAEPKALSLSQERRWGELASFVATLNLNDGSAWMAGNQWVQLQEQWLRLIATLGGFDKTILAEQARLVQREMSFDNKRDYAPFFSLFDSARAAPLSLWERIDDPSEGRKLALAVLSSPRGSAIVAARALASHLDRKGTAESILNELSNLPRSSKMPALWAYFRLIEDHEATAAQLSVSDDETVRESVASLVPLVVNGIPTALGSQLAKDPDRNVQLAVIEQLKTNASSPPSPELLTLLNEIAKLHDAPFTCNHCGTRNEPMYDSCSSCRTVTSKPRVEAQRLLQRLQVQTKTTTDG